MTPKHDADPRPTVNVFQMNGCDWMAGETLESCMADYRDNFSAPDDPDVFEEPHALTAETMQRFKFHDDDGTVRTFQEELDRLVAKGATFPRFFASTEH